MPNIEYFATRSQAGLVRAQGVFLLLALGLCCALGCNPKQRPAAQEKDLNFEYLYLQKVYPGQQDGSIKDYLNFKLNQEESPQLVLDSILLDGITYPLLPDKQEQHVRLQASDAKLAVSTHRPLVIYSHHMAQKYTTTLTKVKRKEALYLP